MIMILKCTLVPSSDKFFLENSLIKDLDTVVEKFKNFGLKDHNPYSGQ